MSDNFIKKIMSTIGRTRQNTGESNEEMKNIIEGLLAQYQLTQAQLKMKEEEEAMSQEFTQDIVRSVLAELERKHSEQSELEAERTRRLKAEKETEELKRKIEELNNKKESNTNNQKGEEYKKLLEALASLGTGGGAGASVSKPNNEANSGKVYSDPAWFPGTSKTTDMNNLASHSNNEKTFQNEMMFNKGHNNSPGFQGFPFEQNQNAMPRYPNNQYGNFPGPPSGNQFNNFGARPQFFPPAGFQGNAPPPPLMNQFPHPENSQYRPNFQPRNPGFTGHRPRLPNAFPNSQSGRDRYTPPHLRNKNASQQSQKNNNQQKQNEHHVKIVVETTAAPQKQRNRTRPNKKKNFESGSNQASGDSTNEPINLTNAEMKQVKHVINTQKCSGETGKPNRSAFKKYKNKQKSPNGPAGANDDNNSNEDSSAEEENSNVTTNPGECSPAASSKVKPSGKFQQQLQGASSSSNEKAKGMVNTGAKAKQKQPANTKKALNKDTDINVFLGTNFPTMEAVRKGTLKLDDPVHDVIMVAKTEDGSKITDAPKTIKEMIVFRQSYPNSKVIIVKDNLS